MITPARMRNFRWIIHIRQSTSITASAMKPPREYVSTTVTASTATIASNSRRSDQRRVATTSAIASGMMMSSVSARSFGLPASPSPYPLIRSMCEFPTCGPMHPHHAGT